MSLIQQIINQLHLFPVWMSNIGHYLRMTKFYQNTLLKKLGEHFMISE